MTIVKSMRIERFLSLVSVLLVVAAGTLMGAGAARADQAGITWTSQTSASDNAWVSVAYGNGLFVAVAVSGSGNRVMTSPDGITWTSRTSAADNSWSSVTYGNGLFVAVAGNGSGNRVMTSPDGIVWTSRTSAADNRWESVTYGGGLFVAVAANGAGNRVMTSPDGIVWTSRASAADNSWTSVTYGNGVFVAIAYTGSGNRVMTSGIVGGSGTAEITVLQGLPLSATGTCEALDDKAVAYGTGLTGGWQRSWEPWVNTTIGADGQRVGGWACIRTLINRGGSAWMIAS